MPTCGSTGKDSICIAGDLSSIHRLGKSPGEGNGYPLHYSGLVNFMNYIVHGCLKELDTAERLSFFTLPQGRPCVTHASHLSLTMYL